MKPLIQTLPPQSVVVKDPETGKLSNSVMTGEEYAFFVKAKPMDHILVGGVSYKKSNVEKISKYVSTASDGFSYLRSEDMTQIRWTDGSIIYEVNRTHCVKGKKIRKELLEYCYYDENGKRNTIDKSYKFNVAVKNTLQETKSVI